MKSEQKPWLNFTDPAVSMLLLQWWRDLDSNRGDRADLRRCRVPNDVVFIPSYHRLRNMLVPLGNANDQSLCIVAGVLSHAREHDGSERFAAQLARKKPGSDTPLMSDLRFRRFLSIREPEILFREAIRAVRLLDGTVNVPDLAHGLYWWNDHVRRQWAFDYYGKMYEVRMI